MAKMRDRSSSYTRELLAELSDLPIERIQEVLDFVRYLKSKTQEVSIETGEKELPPQASLEELEAEFRRAYPDVPLRRELLGLVGGVPDDGKSLAQVMLEHYNSEPYEE